jgi:enamine deaminase RidA (YjgF/YER057c/UK114 family)
MPKQVIYTDRLMRPIAHFSHAARVGNVVHVGATAGVFPDLRLAGDSVGRVDMAAQTRKMFENLGTALGLMGSTLSEVVRLKTYIADPRDMALYSAIYAEHFSSIRPAHTVVGSWSFPLPQAAIELDAVAVSGHSAGTRASADLTTPVTGTASGVATKGFHYATALPVDPDGKTASPVQKEQMAAALRNLNAMLATAGLFASDVCNLHVTLADLRAFADVESRLMTFFDGQLPSCTFVEAPLERSDFRVSLESIAVSGGGRRLGSKATPLREGKPAPAVLAGDTLFLGGQTGTTEGSSEKVDVETQTRIARDRLDALVEAAGFGADSIVRTNNVLTDWRHYAQFNAGYGACMKEPYVPRATVLGRLVDPSAEVQIEGIAHRAGADATILQVRPPAPR